MDLNEARSVAGQLINHYRAFKRIQEFLEVVATATGTVGDLERRRDALSAEIPTIEAEKIRTAESLEVAQAKAREEVVRVEGETADRLAELRGKVEAEEARVHGELAALQVKLETALEQHRAAKEVMEGEAAELTARVAGLKKELTDIVSRHRLQPLGG